MRHIKRSGFMPIFKKGSRNIFAKSSYEDMYGIKIYVPYGVINYEKTRYIIGDDLNSYGSEHINGIEGYYNSVEEIINAVRNATGLYRNKSLSSFHFDDGALICRQLVSDKLSHDSPSEEQYLRYRKHEIELYAADLWIPLVTVDTHKMTSKEAYALGLD